MKNSVIVTAGIVGSWIATALGGWDSAIITLISFMAMDYITGFIVAGVFHASKKTETGGLKSHEGFKGLCKKGMILLLVIAANLLDQQIGASYIRDGVCIAFMCNELLSIVENASLMGLPIPKAITDALDVLTEKQVDE